MKPTGSVPMLVFCLILRFYSKKKPWLEQQSVKQNESRVTWTPDEIDLLNETQWL